MKTSSKVEIRAVTSTERMKEESSVNLTWKSLAPLVVAIGVALMPAPVGLAQHAWYFFAIFAGVIVGLMFVRVKILRVGEQLELSSKKNP